MALTSVAVTTASSAQPPESPQTPPAKQSSHASEHPQHYEPVTVRIGKDEAPDLLLGFGGFLQVDWVAYEASSEDELDGPTRDPLNQMRFLIRRARLRSEFDHPWVFGALEIDGNTVDGPTLRLLDAEASVRWPPRSLAVNAPAPPRYQLRATVGLMRTPFGVDVQEPERSNQFLEKSAVVRALFPGNFDLGVKALASWEFLNASVAGMNGSPIGERQFPGEDPNKSRDVLGRLGADVQIVKGLRVSAGVSALWGTGFHAGNPATKDVLVWRDANENSLVELPEIQIIPGSAATASENFERFAIGGDLRLRVAVPVLGELVLTGELIRGQNLDRGTDPADPIATGRDLREWGGYLSVTQELTRYAAIGVRYDRYDPDADALDQLPFELVPADRTLSTWAFSASGGYPPYARLTAEFDINKNFFGRAADGSPDTLPSNRFTLRAEAGF